MASTNTRIRVTFAGPRVLAVYVLRFHDLTLAPCRPTARLVSALVSTAMFVVNSFNNTTFVVFVKDVEFFLELGPLEAVESSTWIEGMDVLIRWSGCPREGASSFCWGWSRRWAFLALRER